ncbi:SDR family NAD(P)-dependent oxidoreductase [Humitalea sp. 24SJ18S-53]|uniref:SDR family NAD(P)-dependent oxidoreductase n=1 Tax=Humitalea sp. 24SJ18S-53 TaxID=3422307 RepID=UPI003D664863
MSEAHPGKTRRLAGRRILISGAASGIGRATAQLFAAEGAALALLDRNADGLAQVAAETGGHVFQVDITDDDAVASAAEQGAAAMGGIDGVVNAAGIALRGSVKDVDIAEWRRVIDVNLTGSYSVVRHCLPWLAKEASASIVNISSGQGLLPNIPNRTAYAASKGGLVNLTRALAAELAPSIRVNSVCPGLVNTPLIAGVPGNPNAYALRRIAEPMEVAQAVLFMISTDSSYVTGAALAVDGGRSFH